MPAAAMATASCSQRFSGVWSGNSRCAEQEWQIPARILRGNVFLLTVQKKYKKCEATILWPMWRFHSR